MEEILSKQIKSTPSSFIRNIFKTVSDPDIISFAGGLPNPLSFPSNELKISSQRIIDAYGPKVFQYSQTPGLIELRDVIAKRYNKKFNLNSVENDDIDVLNEKLTKYLFSNFEPSPDLFKENEINNNIDYNKISFVDKYKPEYISAQMLYYFTSNFLI